MAQLSNPVTLLATKKEIFDAAELLKTYESNGFVAGVANEDLWKARNLVESAMHPDTKEYIPRPFRISGFHPSAN